MLFVRRLDVLVGDSDFRCQRGGRDQPQPVARVDRCALVKQFGRQIDAVGVDRRKQGQRYLDRGDLRPATIGG